jgi:hypothetical protein
LHRNRRLGYETKINKRFEEMAKGKNHIVIKGDTLYKIARQNRIRYWPNVYFASENNAFRKKCFNPDLIFPSDVVFIPAMTSIAPMEKSPKIIYHDLPLYTQSIDTCWRATGLMLYARRNPGPDAVSKFDSIIGDQYKNRTTGLYSHEWYDFYCMHLGMKEKLISSPNDLHYIIASHGPAVVAIGEGSSGHSMVMAGYDLFLGKWLVLDPAAGEQLQFADDVIDVGSSQSSASESQKPATLTGYKTGPATWKNMHRWLWIMDTTVNQNVYYYSR